MKKLLKAIEFLPHVSIILAVSFIVFTILDWFNPMMNFTANPVSAKLLVVFCAVSIIMSVKELIAQFRKKRKTDKREDE